MSHDYNGAYGTINANGEMLDSLYIEYQYAAHFYGPGEEDCCDTWRYGFRLNDIPIANINTYGNIEVAFDISGLEVRDHIADIILFHHYYESGYWIDGHYIPGSDHYVWEYDSTDWDNEEYPPSLTITFSNVPFEK